jgi:glycosyltransferase involved in cell wall biosynthesis
MIRNEPFFSILIPTFNRCFQLQLAIESVKAQTFSDWEIVVVDDGSQDGTPEMMEIMAKEDPRIRYYWQNNQGPARSRNNGFHQARGQYITFLDSDDQYKPEHLEWRASILQANPEIEMLYGGIEIVGNPWVVDREDPSRLIHLESRDIGVGGAFVLQRKVFTDLGGFPDVQYSEDGLLLANAKSKGCVIRYIAEKTYIYDRQSPDSICTKLLLHG